MDTFEWWANELKQNYLPGCRDEWDAEEAIDQVVERALESFETTLGSHLRTVAREWFAEQDEDEEPDVDDDFPMYVEYDGMWGAPDYLVEEAAQREDMFERGLLGED